MFNATSTTTNHGFQWAMRMLVGMSLVIEAMLFTWYSFMALIRVWLISNQTLVSSDYPQYNEEQLLVVWLETLLYFGLTALLWIASVNILFRKRSLWVIIICVIAIILILVFNLVDAAGTFTVKVMLHLLAPFLGMVLAWKMERDNPS